MITHECPRNRWFITLMFINKPGMTQECPMNHEFIPIIFFNKPDMIYGKKYFDYA